MKTPTSRKEVLTFLGVVDYYRDMWPSGSHTLAPLTRMTSNKKKFKLKQLKQNYSDKIKLTVSRDTLLTYPYFNKTFKIHTNASAFKL